MESASRNTYISKNMMSLYQQERDKKMGIQQVDAPQMQN
jgi:hypothetical protein